jgi:hypothetical protein
MKSVLKWFLFGMIVLFSLCCVGVWAVQNLMSVSNRTMQDVYCRQIQPGMRRDEVFSILKRIGELDIREYSEDGESIAYSISYHFPQSFPYDYAIIYFEDDIYRGKVLYGPFNDFVPVCQ